MPYNIQYDKQSCDSFEQNRFKNSGFMSALPLQDKLPLDI